MFERAILFSALAAPVGTLAAVAPQSAEQPVLGHPSTKPMRWAPFEKQPRT